MIDYEKMDEKKTLGISLFVVAIVIVSIILQLAESVGAETGFVINFVTLIVLVVFFSSLLILTRMKGKKESGKE